MTPAVLARVEILERFLRRWTVRTAQGRAWPRSAQQVRAAQLELVRLLTSPPPEGSYVPHLVEPLPPCWWCTCSTRETVDGRDRCSGCGTWLGLPLMPEHPLTSALDVAGAEDGG